tara:strand:- start:487 stop:1386 length:900 start_codon:yes stop_codon:yes gene_type:complete
MMNENFSGNNVQENYSFWNQKLTNARNLWENDETEYNSIINDYENYNTQDMLEINELKKTLDRNTKSDLDNKWRHIRHLLRNLKRHKFPEYKTAFDSYNRNWGTRWNDRNDAKNNNDSKREEYISAKDDFNDKFNEFRNIVDELNTPEKRLERCNTNLTKKTNKISIGRTIRRRLQEQLREAREKLEKAVLDNENCNRNQTANLQQLVSNIEQRVEEENEKIMNENSESTKDEQISDETTGTAAVESFEAEYTPMTKDRMLELSQDRNSYKQKVIYTLISIIISLLVSIVVAYTYFKKK